MIRVRPTLVRTLLAVGLAAALLAAGVGPAGAWLLLALLPAAASPFVEWRLVRAGAARALMRASALTLAISFALVWVTRPLYGTNAGPWPALLAAILALLACGFALAPGAFAPGRSLVPAILGLLALAGIDPSPAGFGPSSVSLFQAAGHSSFAELYLACCSVAALALWWAALLVVGPAWGRRRLARVALTLAAAAALAVVGVLGLPAAQPRVEQAIAAQFSSAQTGLSEESALGEFASLAASRRRVVDVRAQPPRGQWLLRAERLTRFDGRRWSRLRPPKGAAVRRRALQASKPPDPEPTLLADVGRWFVPAPAVPPGSVALRLNQHTVETWPLLLPRDTVAVTAEVGYLDVDEGFYRRPLGVPVQLYGALVAPAPLRGDAAGVLGEPPAESLELPRLDPRLRLLASALAPASAAPRQKLAATLAHFRSGYVYTLSPGAWGLDPVGEFVFDKRRGYCEYFASAAVVLLRLQGVPARFVKGLRVGPQNDYGDGLHVVRESDAHAWLEAWMPGEGWVEADPTPAGSGLDASPGPLSRLLERLRAALSEAWARISGPGPLAFLRWLRRAVASLVVHPALAAVLLVGLLAFALGRRLLRWLLGRLRRATSTRVGAAGASLVPPDLIAALAELEQAWKAAGHPRPPTRGLREHALALSAITEAIPDRLRNTSPLVDAYYQVRYGGASIAPAEVERFRALLRS